MPSQCNSMALKLTRTAKGMSQADVGLRISRPQCFVSRIERGGSALVTREVASAIAAALETPVELLFPGVDRR